MFLDVLIFIGATAGFLAIAVLVAFAVNIDWTDL